MDENNRFNSGQEWNPTPPPDPTVQAEANAGQTPPPPAPDPTVRADANVGQTPPPPVPPVPPYTAVPPVQSQQPGAGVPYGQQQNGYNPSAAPYGQQQGGQYSRPDPFTPPYQNGNGGFNGQVPPVYPPQDSNYMPYGVQLPQKQAGDSMAVASLVLGIIGMVCCGGGILSILAIVFGFVSRSKGTSKQGMALAGIILGFISLAVGIITTIILYQTGYFLDFVSSSYYY